MTPLRGVFFSKKEYCKKINCPYLGVQFLVKKFQLTSHNFEAKFGYISRFNDTYPVFPRMQIHDQILGFWISVLHFALVAVFVVRHLFGIERQVWRFLPSLRGNGNFAVSRVAFRGTIFVRPARDGRIWGGRFAGWWWWGRNGVLVYITGRSFSAALCYKNRKIKGKGLRMHAKPQKKILTAKLLKFLEDIGDHVS